MSCFPYRRVWLCEQTESLAVGEAFMIPGILDSSREVVAEAGGAALNMLC